MWEEERKELLKQAIEVSLLLPAQTQEEQEEYLCETISELIQLRSTLKYALSKPELQEEFLTRVIHRFLDIFFPILNSPNNIYFKLLELQRHQQVEFFELFFTHYETMFLALREDVKEDYIDKYQKIVNLLSSPFTAERQIWLFIIKELLPIIKRTKHRIKIYQYILNLYITFVHQNNNYCDNNNRNNNKKSNGDVEEDGGDNNKNKNKNKESGDEILNGENLKEVLNDIIRLKEYELLKAYVNTFQLSLFLVNYKFQDGSALQEACSVHSLEIIKYLIEIVGINYHPPLYVLLSQSLPIVTAVKLSRNNNNNMNNKSQINNNNNNDNSNDEQVGSDDDDDEEKRRSREIVEYMVGLYKRDNCFEDEFLKQTKRTANHTFNVNDIVQTAYSHANIPVLLYLKEIGFNISEYTQFLSEAVNSSSVEAVKLYLNDYQLSSSSRNSTQIAVAEKDLLQQYDYSFNEIMFEAGMNDKSFEVLLSVFEEFGINCCSYPILLATGRMEIISRYDFSNYVPKIDPDRRPTLTTPHFHIYHILRCLMTSQYLNALYLEVLFTRYPTFKFYFDKHCSEFIFSIFQLNIQSKYVMKKSIIFQNLISIPNLSQIGFEPYLSLWAKRFSAIPKPEQFNNLF